MFLRNVKWQYSPESRASSECLVQVHLTPCAHGDSLVTSIPAINWRSEKQLLPRKITALKFAFNEIVGCSP